MGEQIDISQKLGEVEDEIRRLQTEIQKLEVKRAVFYELLGKEAPAPTLVIKAPELKEPVTQKLEQDEFHTMTVPDAVLKYLKKMGRPPKTTEQILEALCKHGLKTKYTNVYTSLSRLKDKSHQVAQDDKKNWYLPEWYGKAVPKGGRPPKKTDKNNKQSEDEGEKVEVIEEKKE